MTPNNALERSVKSSRERAAGAIEIVAPAAPGSTFPRLAQRGRQATLIEVRDHAYRQK